MPIRRPWAAYPVHHCWLITRCRWICSCCYVVFWWAGSSCWRSLIATLLCNLTRLTSFEITAGPAAEGYPIEVVEGRFTTSDGNRIPVSPDFLEGDWGTSHTTYVSGDGTAPAPDNLEVRWFSYTEDKFYEGHWLLPQQRMHTLLQQGYWNAAEQKHETYTSLVVCLLPKGVAVVWLAGRNQVLLGRYEGQ